METATLTKPEEAHVDRMADSFNEPSMSDRFKEWASRSTAAAKQEAKKEEGKHRPHEVKLEGRDDQEKKFIQGVGVGEKDETEDSARDAKHTDAKGSEKPDAKADGKSAASESDDSHGEPLSGDLAERHWQGRLQAAEIEKHIAHRNNRAGIIMKYMNQHPQKDAIAEGFRALMAGQRQGVNEPFFRDLTSALAEVENPGEVFRHITLQPQDREWLRAKKGKELRAAIHTLAKHYSGSASKAAPSPKPRAPKPPSEVAGRMSESDDGAVNGFSDFSERQQRRYAR